MRDYVLVAAVEAGDVVPVPAEFEVDHDSLPGRVAHLAVERLIVADEFGTPRRVGPGDLLSSSECHALGTDGLALLVKRGLLVCLPADRGVLALLRGFLGRP
jgi:hypothetical protein